MQRSGKLLLALVVLTVGATVGCGTRVPSPPSAEPFGRKGIDTRGPTGSAVGSSRPQVAPSSAPSQGDSRLQTPRRVGVSNAPVDAGDTSSAGTATTQSEPAPGGTAAPTGSNGGIPAVASGRERSDLVIGSVGTQSGPTGELLLDGVRAVQVWVRFINDRGGVNGHLIRLVVADDGGDPARHRASVQDLVENKGVLAFVQNQEGFSGASAAEYPTKHRIPVINTDSTGDYVYDSPMYFPVTPSGDEYALAVIAAVAQVAVPAGHTNLGIVSCAELPAVCERTANVWASATQALGFRLAYRAQASITQPDFTAECLNARKAGADVIVMAMDNHSIGRFAASCARQGYRPQYAYPSTVARPNLARDPLLEGSIAGAHTFAWPARDNEARVEFHDAFDRFAPGTEVTGGSANGWVAAKALEYATRALPEPPTSAAILAGLWALDGNDLGGLTYPLRFTPNQPSPRVSCGTVVVIQEGRWVAPRGGGVQCAATPYGPSS